MVRKASVSIKPGGAIGGRRIHNAFLGEMGFPDAVSWDVFPVEDGETIRIIFESSNSPWREGVRLLSDEELECNGVTSKQFVFWADTAPVCSEVKVKTKRGLFDLYNTWAGRPGGPPPEFSESCKPCSGMLIDELKNGRRYHCYDIGLDPSTGRTSIHLPPKFDRVVFRIERISNS